MNHTSETDLRFYAPADWERQRKKANGIGCHSHSHSHFHVLLPLGRLMLPLRLPALAVIGNGVVLQFFDELISSPNTTRKRATAA